MIFILNRSEQIVGVLNNDGDTSKITPYYEDVFTEDLNTGSTTFEFRTLGDTKEAYELQVGNLIVFKDDDGSFQLFTITDVEEEHTDVLEKMVYCEGSSLELLTNIVRPFEMPSANLKQFLNTILEGTSWAVGLVDMALLMDSHSIEVTDFDNVYKLLQDIAVGKFGAEIRFRVEISNNRISNKYVDVFAQRGRTTKHRFEYGENITKVVKKVDTSELCTALIGVGNNNLTFKSVSASDKPQHQDFIINQDAYDKWNVKGKHIMGVYKYDTDSPEELLLHTRKELKRRSEPKVTYELDVELLGADVRLGDEVFVIDTDFSPMMLLSARVSVLEKSKTNGNNKCTLANFKEVRSNITDDMRALASQLEGKIDDKFASKFPVKTEDIGDEAVTSDKIGQQAISTIHISNLSADVITSGTINAELVNVTNLNADNITSGSIDAKNILVTNLNADNITTGTLDASKINVTNLSADNITSGTINANIVNVTNLNADNITSGSIDANVIGVNNLNANNITSGVIDASKIFVTNINASNISTGVLNAELVEVKNINADNIISGTIDAQNIEVRNLSASNITTGTLDASQVNVTNLSADNITSGTIDASQINVTNIDASNITSGTISADMIEGLQITADMITTGTLDASKINVTNLSASSITTGSIDASKVDVRNLNASNITSGSIDASKIVVRNLNASNITSGTIDASKVNVVNINASNISTGSIDASTVTILNLSASSIKGGTIDASRINVTNITADNITGGTLNANNVRVSNLSANSITSGTLDASKINVTNLKADNIVTGSITVEGNNLIHNTDFKEKGTWSWSNSTYVIDTDVKYNGANTLKASIQNITADGWSGAYCEYIPCTEGQHFVTSGYLKVQDADGGVYLGLEFYNENKTRISRVAERIENTNGEFIRTVNTGVAPTGARYVRCRFEIQRNAIAWLGHPMLSKGTIASMWKLHTDELISDGAINEDKLAPESVTGEKINVDDVFANTGFIGALQTTSLSADQITTGKISSERLDITGIVSFESLDPEFKKHFKYDPNSGKTFINGNEIYTGSVTAEKINIKGLTVKDSANNITFSISENGDADIKGTIQSYQFSDEVGHESGYKLTPDGDAILNSAKIRGSVILPKGGITDIDHPEIADPDKQIRFWSGSTFEGRKDAPFKVLNDGTVIATMGDFNGTVTGSIDIGNIKIEDTDKTNGAISIFNNGNVNEIIRFNEDLSYIDADFILGNPNNKMIEFDKDNKDLNIIKTKVNITSGNDYPRYVNIPSGNSTMLEMGYKGSYGQYAHEVRYVNGTMLLNNTGDVKEGLPHFKFAKEGADVDVEVDGELSVKNKITINNKIEMIARTTTDNNSGFDFVIK